MSKLYLVPPNHAAINFISFSSTIFDELCMDISQSETRFSMTALGAPYKVSVHLVKQIQKLLQPCLLSDPDKTRKIANDLL